MVEHESGSGAIGENATNMCFVFLIIIPFDYWRFTSDLSAHKLSLSLSSISPTNTTLQFSIMARMKSKAQESESRRHWDDNKKAAAYVISRVLKTRIGFPSGNACIDKLGFHCDYNQCYQSYNNATPEQVEIAEKTEDLLFHIGRALGGREFRNPGEYLLGEREFTFLDLAVLIGTNGECMGKYIVHLVFLNEFQAATLTYVRLCRQQMTAVLMIFQIHYKNQSKSSSRKKQQQGVTLRVGSLRKLMQ